MKSAFVIFLALAVTIGVTAASPATAAQSPPSVQRPELQRGDWWQYATTALPAGEPRRFRIEIVNLSEDVIESRNQTFNRDWSLMQTRRNGEVIYRGDPARPLLHFPLHVGKTWDGAAIGYFPSTVRRWQGRARVERIERVTVPAGSFDAFVIRFEGYYPVTGNTTNNVHHDETIWYASEVGRWVKRDWTTDATYPSFGRVTQRQIEELVAFGRADGSAGATDVTR